MQIILGRSFSKEFNIIEQITIVNEIESDLNKYFTNRDYGNRISQVYLGIICVSEEFEPSFPLSDKLKINRNPPEIEYGVKLDFEYFSNLSKVQKINYIYSEILKRTETMLPTRTVNNFNKKEFLEDLKSYVSSKIR